MPPSAATQPRTLALSAAFALLGALLVPLPLLIFNPDFARTWSSRLQLGVSMAASTVFAAAAGAIACRLCGRSAGKGASGAAQLWLASAITAEAGIVARGTGLALAFAAFATAGLTTLIWPRKPAPLAPYAGLVGAAALIVLLLGSVLSPPQADKPKHQIVMIGLDGAGWPVIDRLRSEGRLPTFDRLVTQGARAELDTLSPTISPALWTSIASGKTPEHHGIKDFWASAEQVRAKRIWEIVDDQGLVSGVFGYLVTWPPRKKVGFLVPGWLAQTEETIPAELSFVKTLQIMTKPGAVLAPSATIGLTILSLRHGVTFPTFKMALAFLLARKFGIETQLDPIGGQLVKFALTTDVFCHLLRRTQPDLAIYYNASTDAVQHLFFKYYAPDKFPSVTPTDVVRYGDAIPRIYEAADKAIARILSAASPNATVLIISDHGQEAAQVEGHHWYTINTKAMLQALGIENDVRATNTGTSVFLRAKASSTRPWRISRKVLSVVTVADGKPLFQVQQRGRGELLLKVRSDLNPAAGKRVRLGDRVLPLQALLKQSPATSGIHTNTAMLLMTGPDIVRATTLPRGNILDVAPTILALLRLPVPRDMQGRVIIEAIRPDLRAALPVGYVRTYGTAQHGSGLSTGEPLRRSTLNRLRTLGYIQ